MKINDVVSESLQLQEAMPWTKLGAKLGLRSSKNKIARENYRKELFKSFVESLKQFEITHLDNKSKPADKRRALIHWAVKMRYPADLIEKNLQKYNITDKRWKINDAARAMVDTAVDMGSNRATMNVLDDIANTLRKLDVHGISRMGQAVFKVPVTGQDKEEDIKTIINGLVEKNLPHQDIADLDRKLKSIILSLQNAAKGQQNSGSSNTTANSNAIGTQTVLPPTNTQSQIYLDAVSALNNQGYNKAQSSGYVKSALSDLGDSASLSEIVRRALQYASGKPGPVMKNITPKLNTNQPIAAQAQTQQSQPAAQSAPQAPTQAPAQPPQAPAQQAAAAAGPKQPRVQANKPKRRRPTATIGPTVKKVKVNFPRVLTQVDRLLPHLTPEQRKQLRDKLNTTT